MDLFEKLRDLDKQRENQRQKYLSLLEDAKRVKQQQLDCVRQVKLHDAARSQHGFSSAFKMRRKQLIYSIGIATY